MADDEPVEEDDTTQTEDSPAQRETSKHETSLSPHAVKLDLGELRELIEGLPEKTAQFIIEAAKTPRKTAEKTESRKRENAPADQSDTPKPSPAGGKRGWLARGLFGD